MKFNSFELQETLYDDLKKSFIDFGVNYVIARGSYYKGNFDRASDIDVLVVVSDDDFFKLLDKLTSIISNHCSLLYKEGWIDTIVPDFGGIGLVYLVEKEGKLIQLDLYVTLQSRSKKILGFEEKEIIYQNPEIETIKDQIQEEQINQYIQDNIDLERQIIFEVLLIMVIYAKQIYRSNISLALKYRYFSIESTVKLLRLVFTPTKIDYLMYDWRRDLSTLNDPIVKRLERNIILIDIFSEEQFLELLKIIKIILKETKLQEYRDEFEPVTTSLEAYFKRLLAIE